MKKKLFKYIKFIICAMLIFSLVAPSYASLSASDGSAFVTKAEFDSALADFNSRLTTFEAGINSKIDSQVTSYLDRNGIWSAKDQDISANATYIYNSTLNEVWYVFRYNGMLNNANFLSYIYDHTDHFDVRDTHGYNYVLYSAPVQMCKCNKSGLMYLKGDSGSYNNPTSNPYNGDPVRAAGSDWRHAYQNTYNNTTDRFILNFCGTYISVAVLSQDTFQQTKIKGAYDLGLTTENRVELGAQSGSVLWNARHWMMFAVNNFNFTTTFFVSKNDTVWLREKLAWQQGHTNHNALTNYIANPGTTESSTSSWRGLIVKACSIY